MSLFRSEQIPCFLMYSKAPALNAYLVLLRVALRVSKTNKVRTHVFWLCLGQAQFLRIYSKQLDLKWWVVLTAFWLIQSPGLRLSSHISSNPSLAEAVQNLYSPSDGCCVYFMSCGYLKLTNECSFRPERVFSLWNLSKPVGLQAMGDASGILTWISAWRVALTSNVSNLCSVWKYSNCTSRTHVRFSAFKFFKDEASAKPCFYSLTQVTMFPTDYLQSYYTSIGCVVSVVSGLNEIMWTPSMRISLFMYTLNLCSVLRYSNSRSPLPCLPCLWAFKREMMFYDLHFTVGDCYLLWIYAKCRSRQPISGLSLFLTCLYESTRRSSFCMSLKSQWAMIVFKKSDIHGHNWIFAPSL